MFLKKVYLTDRKNNPCALGNLGDASAITEVISDIIVNSKATDQFKLGAEIGNALNAMPHHLQMNHRWTLNISKMKARKEPTVVLENPDNLGNLDILVISLEGEFPKEDDEITIKHFYIGSACGSGIKCDSFEEFVDYLRAEVIQRGYDGATDFDITIED